MPTETDVKLAEELADFRVEVERRFGALETTIAGFRSGVETELRIIRKLGTWILGAALGVVAAMVTGAATVAWSASAVVADVKPRESTHAERLSKGSKLPAPRGVTVRRMSDVTSWAEGCKIDRSDRAGPFESSGGISCRRKNSSIVSY